MSEESAAVPRSRSAIRQCWIDRFARFASAELSVAAFCQAEGISTQSFYYWRAKLTAAPATSADSPGLVPIRLLAASNPVEVVLPSGPVLRLAPGCDLAFVRSLVCALELPSC